MDKAAKIPIQREFQVKPGVALLKKDRAFTTNLQFFPCPDTKAIELTNDSSGRQLYRNPIWSYDLGRLQITLLGQADVGLPYGVISRLIINWIDNEIVYNTKKGAEIRGGYKIVWSETISEFCVKNLGIAKTGHALKEIQNQFEKISSMTFRTILKDGEMAVQEEIPFVVEKKFKWDRMEGRLIPGENNSWMVIHPEYVRYVAKRGFYIPPEMIKNFLRNVEGIDLFKYFKYIQMTQNGETEITLTDIKEKIGWEGSQRNLFRKITKIINEIMENDKTILLKIVAGKNQYDETVIVVKNRKVTELLK